MSANGLFDMQTDVFDGSGTTTVGPRLSTTRWLQEAWRAAWFRAPRIGASAPAAWQLALLVLLVDACYLALDWLSVPGPTRFAPAGWLGTWWATALLLWAMWWAMGRTPDAALPAENGDPGPDGVRPRSLAAWCLLYLTASAPVGLALAAFQTWMVRRPDDWPAGWWPDAGLVTWGLWWLAMAWMLAVQWVLIARFVRTRLAVAGLGLLLVGTYAVATVWYQPTWQPDERRAAAADGQAAAEPAYLKLSQAVFEAQQALWQQQLDALAPQRDGVTDVYGLVFAPYAGEEVFRRESAMVAEVLQRRFDAEGRVLQLVNHPATAGTLPWATGENLQRAVAALAERMDREQDVLVVYLTSHGARDHRLAASHWPLEVEPIAPALLRQALDTAGVRHRVVAISACYSGGWIEPLATEHTLVMTAADATHTSYGCGAKSELTFFGRAVFDEQLRGGTHSFVEAFERAVPVIAQREKDAGKSDGFSNPQIRVGPSIGPVLEQLAARQAASAAVR